MFSRRAMVLANLMFFIVAVTAMAFGLFLFRRPQQVFAIQKRFYALINWNIEPISLEKEIRNTRVMGVVLIIFVLGSCLFKLMQ
jgi:hypothetical protein